MNLPAALTHPRTFVVAVSALMFGTGTVGVAQGPTECAGGLWFVAAVAAGTFGALAAVHPCPRLLSIAGASMSVTAAGISWLFACWSLGDTLTTQAILTIGALQWLATAYLIAWGFVTVVAPWVVTLEVAGNDE